MSENNLNARPSVISPFLAGCGRRTYPAIFSFMAGVMPAMPIGMPPVKWSANWDMIVPFLGGLNDGWKARATRRYCAEASSS